MPFVKLDSGLLSSTLWIDREAREIFITALLLAEPHEVAVATPTIKTDSLDLDAFMVPPGWYGLVRASGPGLIHLAIVDPEVGRLALERLSGPDPSSRTHEYEGRRMVRIDGGYIVLNYIKYREHDYTAADRMRKYRAAKKTTLLKRRKPNVT